MITVKPEEYRDAYDFAKKEVHKAGVAQILKRANKALQDTMTLNTSNKNVAQLETFVYAKDGNDEDLEMLEEAADTIRKAGFCVEVDTLDYEDLYMKIFVKPIEDK